LEGGARRSLTASMEARARRSGVGSMDDADAVEGRRHSEGERRRRRRRWRRGTDARTFH
jgi:hypothetical protein